MFQGIIKCKEDKMINYLARCCVAGAQQSKGCYGMSLERKSGASVKAEYISDLSGSYLFSLFYCTVFTIPESLINAIFQFQFVSIDFLQELFCSIFFLPGSTTLPFSKSHALSSVLLCRPRLLVGSLE